MAGTLVRNTSRYEKPDDVRFVTLEELQELMNKDSKKEGNKK